MAVETEAATRASAWPVADLATTAVPVAAPGDRAGQVVAGLMGRRFDEADVVAVLCPDGRLAGVARLEDLLAAPPDEPVEAVMDADPPTVTPGADQEIAAWRAVHHAEGVLAVVGADGRFAGLVPGHRMLGVLLREHDEDMARLGGFLARGRSARTASREPVLRRFWHRLPWLILGLAGAVAAAGIVGGFESELDANTLIAFFIPGVVYMADAVGTQTETIVIRGLSAGVPVGSMVRRELATGVLVGVVLAALFAAIAFPIWGDAEVVGATAIAIFAACATATLVAMALPALLARLGTDPAFGSGPLATVVQDLLSILIYFAVVSALVG
jgi:magnesium transporter